MTIESKQVSLPDFGMASEMPDLPVSVLSGRLQRTLMRMEQRSIEVLLVYGDREHFANLE